MVIDFLILLTGIISSVRLLFDIQVIIITIEILKGLKGRNVPEIIETSNSCKGGLNSCALMSVTRPQSLNSRFVEFLKLDSLNWKQKLKSLNFIFKFLNLDFYGFLIFLQVGFLNADVMPELSSYETDSWTRYKWDTIQVRIIIIKVEHYHHPSADH